MFHPTSSSTSSLSSLLTSSSSSSSSSSFKKKSSSSALRISIHPIASPPLSSSSFLVSTVEAKEAKAKEVAEIPPSRGVLKSASSSSLENDRFRSSEAQQIHLKLHRDKTRIVYCKDGRREGNYPYTQFDLLGYTFRRRWVKGRQKCFLGFTPAASSSAQKSMRAKTRCYQFYKRTDLDLQDIARLFDPVLRGWIEYYGKYHRSGLYPVLRHFNKTLVA